MVKKRERGPSVGELEDCRFLWISYQSKAYICRTIQTAHVLPESSRHRSICTTKLSVRLPRPLDPRNKHNIPKIGNSRVDAREVDVLRSKFGDGGKSGSYSMYPFLALTQTLIEYSGTEHLLAYIPRYFVFTMFRYLNMTSNELPPINNQTSNQKTKHSTPLMVPKCNSNVKQGRQ